jgi:neuropeptide Y receptor
MDPSMLNITNKEDNISLNFLLNGLNRSENNWSEPKNNSLFDSNFVEFEDIDGGLKVFFYGLYLLIFMLGIAGNALVCYVVLRNPSMHTVTNIFITNLALSDILLCIFAVPFTPLYLLTYKEWVFGSALCHLVPYAQGLNFFSFNYLKFFSYN